MMLVKPPLRISRDGGEAPVWSRDGTTLYFQSGSSLMASRVTMVPELRAEEPRLMMELGDNRALDVGQDGRFLALHRAEPHVAHLEIVFIWSEELKRIAPTDD